MIINRSTRIRKFYKTHCAAVCYIIFCWATPWILCAPPTPKQPKQEDALSFQKRHNKTSTSSVSNHNGTNDAAYDIALALHEFQLAASAFSNSSKRNSDEQKMRDSGEKVIDKLQCAHRLHDCNSCLIRNECHLLSPMLCIYEFQNVNAPHRLLFLHVCSSSYFSCPRMGPIVDQTEKRDYKLLPKLQKIASPAVCAKLIVQDIPIALQRYLCAVRYTNCTDCVSNCVTTDNVANGWCSYVNPYGERDGICGLTVSECKAFHWPASITYAPKMIDSISLCKFSETGEWTGSAHSPNPSSVTLFTLLVFFYFA